MQIVIFVSDSGLLKLLFKQFCDHTLFYFNGGRNYLVVEMTKKPL